MLADSEPYIITLLKALPAGIIGAILVALFQRWWKTTGRINVDLEVKSFAYSGKDPRGSSRVCGHSEALAVGWRFRLIVFSYKESATAFTSLRLSFRKDGKTLLERVPKTDGREVTYFEIPPRKHVEVFLEGYTDDGSQATKQIALSDSVYLETIDAEGKRREYLIARINPPDKIPLT
jgi:hypothetical protein